MLIGPRTLLVASLVALVVSVTLARTDPDAWASTEIQLQLGDLLFAEGRYSEAVKAYDRAKERAASPQLPRAVGGLVKALLRISEFGRARVEADALRSELPRDPASVALHGDAQWAGGLFEEAEASYRDALLLEADQPSAHHGLAKSLAARGRFTEALEEVQQALKLSPRNGEFHHTMGRIFERMRRFQEAAAAFGNYLNLLPKEDRSDKAAWSRNAIRFLRSFGARVPYEVEAEAEPENSAELYTVPFRLVKDKVVIRGSVNGSDDMDFVLDTGAEETVLSGRVARRLSVPVLGRTLSAGVGEVGLRGLEVGRIDELQIGDLRVRNVPCLIKSPELRDLPIREGESFSPLPMGLSMIIDYGRQELTMGRHLPDEPFDVELPLRVHRLATVRGTINDSHPASFVVDTGGEVISLSAATASDVQPRTPSRRIPLRVYGTSGWDRNAFLMPGIDLSFDRIELENFPVVVLDLRGASALLGFQVGGIVGHRFLQGYRVVIDLERSVVRFRARAERLLRRQAGLPPRFGLCGRSLLFLGLGQERGNG